MHCVKIGTEKEYKESRKKMKPLIQFHNLGLYVSQFALKRIKTELDIRWVFRVCFGTETTIKHISNLKRPAF